MILVRNLGGKQMKRQEIAQKLDEMVKDMPGTFYVHNDGDLNLEWDGNKVVQIKGWNPAKMILNFPKEFTKEEWKTVCFFQEEASAMLIESEVK